MEEQKRALHIPWPMTGKPVEKVYFDWNRYVWVRGIVIELGARDNAVDGLLDLFPGLGLNAQPKRLRDYRPTPSTQREKLHAFLRMQGPSTIPDIAAELGLANDEIAALLDEDPLLEKVKLPGQKANHWQLLGIQ